MLNLNIHTEFSDICQTSVINEKLIKNILNLKFQKNTFIVDNNIMNSWYVSTNESKEQLLINTDILFIKKDISLYQFEFDNIILFEFDYFDNDGYINKQLHCEYYSIDDIQSYLVFDIDKKDFYIYDINNFNHSDNFMILCYLNFEISETNNIIFHKIYNFDINQNNFLPLDKLINSNILYNFLSNFSKKLTDSSNNIQKEIDENDILLKSLTVDDRDNLRRTISSFDLIDYKLNKLKNIIIKNSNLYKDKNYIDQGKFKNDFSIDNLFVNDIINMKFKNLNKNNNIIDIQKYKYLSFIINSISIKLKKKIALKGILQNVIKNINCYLYFDDYCYYKEYIDLLNDKFKIFMIDEYYKNAKVISLKLKIFNFEDVDITDDYIDQIDDYEIDCNISFLNLL